MRTKDKAKCSFYKARRKQGLGDEEIKRLWIGRKMAELEAEEKAKAAAEKAEADRKAAEEAAALAKLEAEEKKG